MEAPAPHLVQAGQGGCSLKKAPRIVASWVKNMYLLHKAGLNGQCHGTVSHINTSSRLK